MRLTLRDAVAGVLVAGILVPYFGYLVRGEMPFIEDPRGMSATAIVLGVAAFLVAGRLSVSDTIGKVELALAVITLAFGIVTLALAETTAAEVLLAVFVAAVVGVWAVQLLHHAGWLPDRSTPNTALHR
jgi:hypothetical protein